MSDIHTTSYLLSKTRREAKKASDLIVNKAKKAKWDADSSAIEVAANVEWATRDMSVAKALGTELAKRYPNHSWYVDSDSRNGVVYIYNMALSGRYGYILKMADINWADTSRQMMRIGGELLRRFGVNHDKLNEQELATIQHNFQGNIRIDLS